MPFLLARPDSRPQVRNPAVQEWYPNSDSIQADACISQSPTYPVHVSLDVSAVCSLIQQGMWLLIYDKTQDIKGCDALDIER